MILSKDFFTLKGFNINSLGQNDEGVSPRVGKDERKPSAQKYFSWHKSTFGRN